MVALINASAQMILAVKAVLIFKSEWIVDYEEDEIIVLARVAEIGYVGIRVILDYLMPERETFLIELFAGVQMKTSIGTGPFSGVMFVIFLITFFVLRVKAPTLPGDENEENRKFKMSLVLLLFVGIIQFSLDVSLRAFMSLNRVDTFVATYTFQLIINYIVAPYYFIHSIPNLNQFAYNQISDHVISPIIFTVRNSLGILSNIFPSSRVGIIEIDEA